MYRKVFILKSHIRSKMGGPNIAYFFQLLVNCDCVVSNMPRSEGKNEKAISQMGRR